MSRPRGSPRELNSWLRQLARAGYEVYIARSGHWHIRRNGRLLTTVSVSPATPRAARAKPKAIFGARKEGEIMTSRNEPIDMTKVVAFHESRPVPTPAQIEQMKERGVTPHIIRRADGTLLFAGARLMPMAPTSTTIVGRYEPSSAHHPRGEAALRQEGAHQGRAARARLLVSVAVKKYPQVARLRSPVLAS
jgi:hypothetical protein